MTVKTLTMVMGFLVVACMSGCAANPPNVKVCPELAAYSRIAVVAEDQTGRFYGQGPVLEIETRFASELGRRGFEVVERRELDRILQEHQVSRSGLIREDLIPKIGDAAGAQAILIASITKCESQSRKKFEKVLPNWGSLGEVTPDYIAKARLLVRVFDVEQIKQISNQISWAEEPVWAERDSDGVLRAATERALAVIPSKSQREIPAEFTGATVER